MTQEEKQLLLKDLCARLFYGVKFQGEDSKVYTLNAANYFALQVENVVFKPYLRPLSSMTEEEREEFRTLIFPEASCAYEDCLEWDAQIIGGGYLQISVEDFSNVVDWLIAHHFDFRGIIPMGLALEAPEGMYKTE